MHHSGRETSIWLIMIGIFQKNNNTTWTQFPFFFFCCCCFLIIVMRNWLFFFFFFLIKNQCIKLFLSSFSVVYTFEGKHSLYKTKQQPKNPQLPAGNSLVYSALPACFGMACTCCFLGGFLCSLHTCVHGLVFCPIYELTLCQVHNMGPAEAGAVFSFGTCCTDEQKW